MYAKKIKSLLAAIIGTLITTGNVLAGHPFVMSEERACAEADLVIVARVDTPRVLDFDSDPFSKSGEWGAAFSKIATVKVSQILLGKEPREVRLYGGAMPGGTDYRILEGEFLLLLKKMKDGAYRAVDWHYSFTPIKDGRVGWLMDEDPNPEKREWLPPAAVLQRIKAFKSKIGQAGTDQPATKPADKPPLEDHPSTSMPKDGPRWPVAGPKRSAK